MDTQSRPALEIEAIASSALVIAPDPDDRPERSSTPEPAGRGITRWLVDAVLLAGAAGAAMHCGIWRDPTAFRPE
jgi:Cu/Zn superoxide dismutase